MADDVLVGRPLRQARGDIPLRFLATETGISVPHLSEIERGVRIATDAQLRALSDYFKATVRYALVPVVIERLDT